jgi:hypothetical protein
MMNESDRKSIAALLYVTLRRTANRVIDVEWLGKNEDYAREVIQLARQHGTHELAHYADRYEALVFGTAADSKPITVATQKTSAIPDNSHASPDIESEDGEHEEEALPGHYIGTLR